MIVRASVLGFVLWLAVILGFRFFGQDFFYPDEGRLLLLLIASPILMALITALALRILGAAKIDRAEASVGLALPGMALSVYAINAFSSVFPNLDPTLDGAFAATAMLGFCAILLTGLVTTRIAPSDEKI